MVEPVLILLGVLAVTGGIVYLIDKRMAPREGDNEVAEAAEEPVEAATACEDENCVLHSTCPTVQLLADEVVAGCKPPYFDDEELDAFRGRAADEYTDDELEQWRDVLYTLVPADRAPWQHSIERRGIAMPEVIRDELLMLMAEQR